MEDKKGQKFSEGKLPIGKVLLKQFPKAFQEVVRNSNTGHQKYILTDSNWDNWKHVKGGKETYIDAALRHLIQAENEVWDKDTEAYGGSRHLSSAAWNLIAALELDLIEEEKQKELLKREGMDKPHEIKETSKLVGDINFYKDLYANPNEEVRKGVDPNPETKEKYFHKFSSSMMPLQWYPYGQNPYHTKAETDKLMDSLKDQNTASNLAASVVKSYCELQEELSKVKAELTEESKNELKPPRLTVEQLFQQNITPMTTTLEQEALKLVEDLNNESWIDVPMHENKDHLVFNPFKFESNGYDVSIIFMGLCIWDSDNDDREIDEDNEGQGEEKIPLRDHILSRSKTITKHLKRRMKLI